MLYLPVIGKDYKLAFLYTSIPPSQIIQVPPIKEAASEIKYKTAPTISMGCAFPFIELCLTLIS
jgi:hypothetical protein